jgi:hypothetical protein
VLEALYARRRPWELRINAISLSNTISASFLHRAPPLRTEHVHQEELRVRPLQSRPPACLATGGWCSCGRSSSIVPPQLHLPPPSPAIAHRRHQASISKKVSKLIQRVPGASKFQIDSTGPNRVSGRSKGRPWLTMGARARWSRIKRRSGGCRVWRFGLIGLLEL